MHPDSAHMGRLIYFALGFLGLDVAPAAAQPGLCVLHACGPTRGKPSASSKNNSATRQRFLRVTSPKPNVGASYRIVRYARYAIAFSLIIVALADAQPHRELPTK